MQERIGAGPAGFIQIQKHSAAHCSLSFLLFASTFASPAPRQGAGTRVAATRPSADGAACAEAERDARRASYTAPELLRGERWGAPADIYSFGCVLCRLGSQAPLHARAFVPARAC